MNASGNKQCGEAIQAFHGWETTEIEEPRKRSQGWERESPGPAGPWNRNRRETNTRRMTGDNGSGQNRTGVAVKKKNMRF